MWSAVENACSPVTAPIRSRIVRIKLLYYFFSYATGFCSPRPGFLTGNVLRDPANGGRFFLPKKRWVKCFLQKIFQPHERLSYIFFHALQNFLLQLARTCCRGVLFLRIFLCPFFQSANVPTPFIPQLFLLIDFGFVIPNITSKIMWARAYFKPMKLSK